ncbi:MAG: AAA domain-containing protein [Candidatus Bathyarchaeia archaeon]|jgi:hypothetical protein
MGSGRTESRRDETKPPGKEPTGDALSSNLVAALNDEIEHIKKEGGSRSYTIKNGERISEIAGRFVYSFDFDGDRLETDVPVQLQIGDSQERIQADVVSVVGQEIMLAVKSTLPENIPKARMFADPLFILERLRDCLKSPPQNFNHILAHKLFRTENQPNLGRVRTKVSGNLNEFQTSAVERCLGSEVFFIWGPPGTGKTTTISTIISHAFADGKNILISSNTNVAIDNAISGAEKSIREKSGYQPGDIVRVGVPQAYVPDSVLPQQIAKEKQEQIDREIQELEKANKTIHSQIQSFREKIRILDECDRLTALEKNQREQLSQTKAQLQDLDRQESTKRDQLNKARSMSSIGRKLRRLEVDEIAIALNKISTRRQSVQTQFASDERQYRYTCTVLQPVQLKAADVIGDYFVQYGTEGNKTALTDHLNEALTSLEANTARISELEKAKSSIEKEIIAKAKVIGTTLAKTWLTAEIMTRKFDLVVVDEASMATLPMLYFVAGLSSGRILIVGDFKQIPAIVMAETDYAKHWLRRDIFQVVGVTDLEAGTDLCEMLRIQYRMNPDISKIVSTRIYGGHLQDHGSVKRSPNVDRPPGAGFSLILLDTSNLNPWSMTHDESYSRINLIHAELAVYMAKEAIKNGFTKIGIITPYRAQARILGKRIEDSNLRKYVEVATVHRFQGREKEVIIFDVSDSKPYHPSRLVSVKNSEENQSERLLNVAVSRAQDKLILIGNLSYLSKELSSDELLPKIIGDCSENGIQLMGEQFLTYPSESSEQTDSQEGILTYKAEDFYPALESDLTNAKEDIAIVSPFVTARRVAKLEETFTAAIKRGVNVRILTKPPDKQFDSEPLKRSATEGIQILKDIGARMELNPRTHEKICVIDNSIVWHGSLNILSQYESSESMMRFVGENTARQLLNDVGLKAESLLKPVSFAAIHDGMRAVTATGKIVRMGPVQFRRKRDGTMLRFAEAVLQAEGNECNLILWGSETDRVKVGDDIRIVNGYTRAYNGKVSLQSGKFGKLEVLQPIKERVREEEDIDDIPEKVTVESKGVCRHCGRTILAGSVSEHETKCAAPRS